MNDNLEKQLEQIIKNAKKYVVRGDVNKRNLDAANPTTADNANVLATLISDLKKQRILK